MKTNLRFLDTEYYVNDDKKTVVCVITVSSKYFDGMLQVFSAKSKCSPEDKFDVVKGKRIAESRAKAKAYKAIRNIYNEGVEYYTERINQFKKLADFTDHLYEKELQHVENIVNI